MHDNILKEKSYSLSLGRLLRNSVIPAKAGIQSAFTTKESIMSSQFTPIPTFPLKGEELCKSLLGRPLRNAPAGEKTSLSRRERVGVRGRFP